LLQTSDGNSQKMKIIEDEVSNPKGDRRYKI